MTATAVNEPNTPYFGGTDNPGDNTALAGRGVNTEPCALGPRQLGVGFSVFGGQDTTIGLVPASGGDSGSDYGNASTDPAGPTLSGGKLRVPGQDETIGEEETSGGTSPTAFPEPTP